MSIDIQSTVERIITGDIKISHEEMKDILIDGIQRKLPAGLRGANLNLVSFGSFGELPPDLSMHLTYSHRRPTVKRPVKEAVASEAPQEQAAVAPVAGQQTYEQPVPGGRFDPEQYGDPQ